MGNGPVHSARYAAAGGTWTSPVNLSVTDGGPPLIAVDAVGNAMAVWSHGSYSSRFARYTAASGAWTSASDLGPAAFSAGQVKFDGSGNAIVVGSRVLTDALGILIGQVGMAMHYTASSASWNPSVIGIPDDQGFSSPDMAIDAAGNVTLVFSFWVPGPSGQKGIHARHYTAASGTWAGVDLVRDGWWHFFPRVTVDASGNLTAVWHVGDTYSPVGIWAARRPAGGEWEAPVIVRRRWTQWDGPSLAPTLPVNQAGDVMLVWSFFDSPAAGSSLESTRWLANGTGVPPAGPPGAPSNFGATVSGNIVSLAWSAPTTGAVPTDYTLLGRLSAGGPVVATVPMGPGASFSIAAPNGTFVLSVRATNGSGTGPESNSVTVTVPQSVSPPGAPSNLASSVTGTTASFTWSPPSSGGAVANYVLVAGLTPGFSVPYASVPIGATPGAVVPGVPAGTYYVRVLAQNAGGTSAPSNEVALTVAGLALPDAPTLHAPTVNGSTVTLSWSPGSGSTPTAYTLAASVTPGGAPVATIPLTGTSVSFSGVPSGTYYLRLTASNAAGISPPSAEMSLSVP